MANYRFKTQRKSELEKRKYTREYMEDYVKRKNRSSSLVEVIRPYFFILQPRAFQKKPIESYGITNCEFCQKLHPMEKEHLCSGKSKQF